MTVNFQFRILTFAVSLIFAAMFPLLADAADSIFTNGYIYTVNPSQPWAETIAIDGNKIVYVGTAEGAGEFIEDATKMVNLDGSFVLPGFVSTHDHLIGSNWTSAGVQLFDAKSAEEVLQLIKEYAEANPDQNVIKGVGWNSVMFGGRFPTAKELDTAVSDRPAIILDYTIHDAWLNTAALQAGNITKETKDWLPGTTYWVRDDEGNPTGAAIEGQWMGTYIAAGAWEPETMLRESADTLLNLAARNGTTAILVPGIITPNLKDTHDGMEKDFILAMDMLVEMDKNGELPLRVQGLPFFKNAEGDPEKFITFAAQMKQRYHTDRVMVKSVKVHPEGNWTSHVSPFIEPYANKDTKGSFNVAPEVTKAIVLLAAKVGLDVVIHSDGDASNRAAVDAIEAAYKAGYTDNRSAIHHASWIHPDDQKRIIDLKIPINATPNFYNDYSGQDIQAIENLGKERVNSSLGRYPHFARNGVKVSISADVPSTPPSMQSPLFVIQGAITLMDPGAPGKSKPFPPNRLGMTVEQAIRAMTIDAAWQMRMEDKIGSIEVGKYADLVVLDASPLHVNPLEIAEIGVLMTIMDGKITYQAPKVQDRDIYLSPAEFTSFDPGQ